ncbi:MAG TPA: hypothetical protein VGO93_28355 [Candidatus Xenobia bacterium]
MRWGDALEARVRRQFGPGANNFVVPTKAQFDAYKGVVVQTEAAIKGGRTLADAQKAAAALKLQLTQQDGCWMLQDELRGWGTVMFNAHPHSGLILEVPHPAFDLGTPELGWEMFRKYDADVLIVAGAARGNRPDASPQVPNQPTTLSNGFDPWHHGAGVPDYSVSDPTHAVDTPFEAAHEALVGPGSVVVQVHGFNAAKHHQANPAFPADRQVVLTPCADDHYYPPVLEGMAKALTTAGYKTGVVSFDDEASSELSATINVQHAYMAQQGLVGPGKPAQFVHIELDSSLRRGPDRGANFTRLLDVLQPVLGTQGSSSR